MHERQVKHFIIGLECCSRTAEMGCYEGHVSKDVFEEALRACHEVVDGIDVTIESIYHACIRVCYHRMKLRPLQDPSPIIIISLLLETVQYFFSTKFLHGI